MICTAIASLVAELAVYAPLEANWASPKVIMPDAITLTIPTSVVLKLNVSS
ncbi:hypothetical protein F4809DRAFT_636751 [Biscogniauxia mediterranea]|nr:hypothetical protein F4809DRAFT_636751 [Biscogniauxia mediterranea]